MFYSVKPTKSSRLPFEVVCHSPGFAKCKGRFAHKHLAERKAAYLNKALANIQYC